MNTLQNYIDRYDKVIRNLGYTGQAPEVLKHLLANATYISEVEHATYMAEASLERASLLNSKIQHCVNMMYSVYRGSCPRVIMKVMAKNYITLNPFDKIAEAPNFSVYYLGYYRWETRTGNSANSETSYNTGDEDEGQTLDDKSFLTNRGYKVIDISGLPDNGDGTGTSGPGDGEATTPIYSLDELIGGADDRYTYTGDWVEDTATFYPATSKDDKSAIWIIKCFIAPKVIGAPMEIDSQIRSTNTYYLDCTSDNLSDDVFVQVADQRVPKTRLFADHILNNTVFDLTLPSFGSRLYFVNYFSDLGGQRDSRALGGITPGTRVKAQFYKYSELSDYNPNDLKRVSLKDFDYMPFNDGFLKKLIIEETVPGLCYVDAIPHDDLNTIHYKANRDRYVNSILRSNSDIGTVLEETFPEIIVSGGTSYSFKSSTLDPTSVDIYYIPKNENVILTQKQIDSFTENKQAYYIVSGDKIKVNLGTKYIATFTVSIDLYRNTLTDFKVVIGDEIIKANYEKKFGIEFGDETMEELRALISKVSNVKRVSDLSVKFTDISGNPINLEDKSLTGVYFETRYVITTNVIIGG